MPVPDIKIKVPFNVRFNHFYCPACGQKIMDESQCAENPCPHILFAYIPEVDGFIYIAKQIKTLSNNIPVDTYPPYFLAQKLHIPTAMVFSIETTGLACGPVSSNIHIGVDLCPEISS